MQNVRFHYQLPKQNLDSILAVSGRLKNGSELTKAEFPNIEITVDFAFFYKDCYVMFTGWEDEEQLSKAMSYFIKHSETPDSVAAWECRYDAAKRVLEQYGKKLKRVSLLSPPSERKRVVDR